jgi:hypothetical protein
VGVGRVYGHETMNFESRLYRTTHVCGAPPFKEAKDAEGGGGDMEAGAERGLQFWLS